jgi:hypothetical protein
MDALQSQIQILEKSLLHIIATHDRLRMGVEGLQKLKHRISFRGRRRQRAG